MSQHNSTRAAPLAAIEIRRISLLCHHTPIKKQSDPENLPPEAWIGSKLGDAPILVALLKWLYFMDAA